MRIFFIHRAKCLFSKYSDSAFSIISLCNLPLYNKEWLDLIIKQMEVLTGLWAVCNTRVDSKHFTFDEKTKNKNRISI